MICVKISLILASLIALTYCNAIPDNGSRLIEGDYTPTGHVINLGNLPIYESPDNGSRRMLIIIHDIFGFSSTNLRQVTDLMALQGNGFRTVLPDFFRGQSWDINIPVDPNNSPPALIELINRAGDWTTIVRPDIMNVLNHYRNQGIEEFAIFGLCWGGQIATLSAIELVDEFRASAFIHPLNVANAQGQLVRMPLYLIPSRDEFDMFPFYQAVRNNFGDLSGYRRFDNMGHGFAATVGNFNDPLTQASVSDVIRALGTFFERVL